MRGKCFIAAVAILAGILYLSPHTVWASGRSMESFLSENKEWEDQNISYSVTIEKPPVLMKGSPVTLQIVFNGNSYYTGSTYHEKKGKLKIRSGKGLVFKDSTSLICDENSLDNCNRMRHEVNFENILFTQNQYESGLHLGMNSTLLFEVASPDDCRLELFFLDQDGSSLYEKKIDFSPDIGDGQDSYQFQLQKLAHFLITTAIYADPKENTIPDSEKKKSISKYENSEINSKYNINVTGDLKCSLSGTVPGSKEATSDPSLQRAFWGYLCETLAIYPTQFDIEIGNQNSSIVMESSINDVSNEPTYPLDSTVSNNRLFAANEFYFENRSFLSVELPDTASPAGAQQEAAVQPEGSAGETAQAAMLPQAEKRNNTIPPAAAASIPIAAAGLAGLVFILLSRPDMANLIQYMSFQSGDPAITEHGQKSGILQKWNVLFLYLKLRKYTLIMGTDEESGENNRIMRKIRLKYRSGSKENIDLSSEMKNDRFAFIRIRHPLKALKHKKDVTIAYSSEDAVLEQDHFQSGEDFVNIKLIEK